MRTSLAAIFALALTIPALAGEQQRRLDLALADCQTLDACIANLDAALTPSELGRTFGDEPAISSYLMRFGEAGKQELLQRANGQNRAWRNLAGAVLMYRHDFTPADMPMLTRALQLEPGGWAAHPLGDIGTPEAVKVLTEDVAAHGVESQSGSVLARFGTQVLPYVWPMFTDNRRWRDGAKLLKQIGTANVDPEEWTALALDRTQPKRARIAALRIIRSSFPDSNSAGPALYPLLDETDGDIRNEALDTLRPMGDTVVLEALVRRCSRMSDPVGNWREPYLCVQEIAAYGQAVRPFGARLADTFLSSANGMDRADGASLIGYVGYDGAKPKLISLLADKDWRVVYASARALAWLGTQEAIQPLDSIAATHWSPLVRDMARQARDAIDSSTTLPKPPVTAATNSFPARIDFDVDRDVLPPPQACSSNVWQWQGRYFWFPEVSGNGIDVWPDRVAIEAKGRLPRGELYGVRAGEYAWMEFKPRFGRAVNVQGGAVNGLLVARDGIIAVLPGPAYQIVITDRAGNVIDPSKFDPPEFIAQPDFTGANYAMKFTRDTRGVWHGQEIARFVRGAGVPVTFGPNLFAAGYDGEVIVFSPDGILGVAECAVN